MGHVIGPGFTVVIAEVVFRPRVWEPSGSGGLCFLLSHGHGRVILVDGAGPLACPALSLDSRRAANRP